MLEIEYVVGDVNPFDELLRQPAPVGVLLDATGGEPTRSLRYTDVMVPSGIEHELRVVFRHQQRPWGALVLLRSPDEPGFTAREREAVGSLGPTLALALKGLLLRGFVGSGGVPEHAGLLLIGADGGVESATAEATHWLEDLRDHDGEVPLTVRALVASAGDRDGGAVRARARGRSGAWLTLTAWRLGDRIAVSMESAAPHDLTALALEAYSLSPREREVVELVLLGWSTSEIGARLHLSPYTVQDHLKTVFDKTGVRSRRELAADLFFRHYLPRIERGARLTADGWFAD
jgi:DNA-binding CsgD family transcriptional regulator